MEAESCKATLAQRGLTPCTFTAHQNPIQQLEIKHSLTKLTSKQAGGTFNNFSGECGTIPQVFLTDCISESVTRAVLLHRGSLAVSVWGWCCWCQSLQPQTSTRHFNGCHTQRRVQTILNKLPEMHKQQLPAVCARCAPQMAQRDLQDSGTASPGDGNRGSQTGSEWRKVSGKW